MKRDLRWTARVVPTNRRFADRYTTEHSPWPPGHRMIDPQPYPNLLEVFGSTAGERDDGEVARAGEDGAEIGRGRRCCPFPVPGLVVAHRGCADQLTSPLTRLSPQPSWPQAHLGTTS
jgi:hypothetical protein